MDHLLALFGICVSDRMQAVRQLRHQELDAEVDTFRGKDQNDHMTLPCQEIGRSSDAGGIQVRQKIQSVVFGDPRAANDR
jgi:hypothetical protein